MRLLHISDVHFGRTKNGHSSHVFTRGKMADPTALVDALPKAEDARPDIVVLSGDVVWAAQASEYEAALVFCNQIRTKYSAEIVVIPGNHDVDRGDSTKDEFRQDTFVNFIRQLYGKDTSKRYPLLDKTDLSLSVRQRLVAFYESPARDLVVVSVNSASRIHGWTRCRTCMRRRSNASVAVCAECKIFNPVPEPSIAIEPDVIRVIDKLLESVSERALKVFVLHHNPLPFTEPYHEGTIELAEPLAAADMTMLSNSALLQSWLARKGFHLVLHGHKHQPHGREDTLYRREDGSEGRRVVILGAGSTGVNQHERGPEPLSFYLINCDRLSNQRFRIRSEPMKIELGSLVPYSAPDAAPFVVDAGPTPPAQPLLFFAEQMTDCHEAISRDTASRRGIIRNFMSVVDSVDFEVPSTTHLEGKPVAKDLVYASFYALHPEYDKEFGWVDCHEVNRRLGNVLHRFRFQHGPRMFGLKPGSRAKSPMVRAIDALKARPETSHAFIGVYHPQLDTVSRAGPPPALTGVQFSIEGERLDLTFTFRKLDLSFWWVVNMLEAINLWNWARDEIRRERQCEKGRITFFAAMAEWKRSGAGAPFRMQIDETPLEELIEITLAAGSGDSNNLISLLREKRERTNENNIDATGLASLAKIVGGVLKVPPQNHGRWNEEVFEHLNRACEELRNAEREAHEDRPKVVQLAIQRATAAIERAEMVLSRTMPSATL